MAHLVNDLHEEICKLRKKKLKVISMRRGCDIVCVGHRGYIACFDSKRRVPVMAALDVNTNSLQAQQTPLLRKPPGKARLYQDKLICVFPSYRQPAGLQISEFDLITKEWSICLTTGYAPSVRRRYAWEFIQEHNIFLMFGGVTQVYLNEVYLYDPERRSWIYPKVKGKAPSGRGSELSCAHGGVFFKFEPDYRKSGNAMFMLQLTQSGVVQWSTPKISVQDRLAGQFKWFNLVPFQGMLLCFGTRVAGRQGLRGEPTPDGLGVYDPNTRRQLFLGITTPEGATGFGDFEMPVLFNSGGAIGVIEGTSFESYVRVSADNGPPTAHAIEDTKPKPIWTRKKKIFPKT